MDKKNMTKFLGTTKMSVVDAMTLIDINSKGIIFITNETEKLVGCITDGDIRRWIIKTGDLNVPVEAVMNSSPKVLFAKEANEAKNLMCREHITAVPILNNEQKIEDIIFLSEFANLPVVL